MNVTWEKVVVWALAIIVCLLVVWFLKSMLQPDSELVGGFFKALKDAPAQVAP